MYPLSEVIKTFMSDWHAESHKSLACLPSKIDRGIGIQCKPISSNLVKSTVKILKFGTPQTFAIIVLKLEKFDVTLH